DLSTQPYFTIAHTGNVIECISFSSADWDDGTPAAVWDCGVTPDSTTSVTIDNGTIITVDADASCYDLLIEEGGSLLLSPGIELVIKGDITINSGVPDGSLFCGAGSRIIFRGSEGSAQIMDNNTATALDIAELQVSNTDGLTLATGGSYGVSEGLFLTGGSITNSGTFTLTSDATSTGHIAQVNGSNSIIGTLNVERFRSARAADWSTIGNSGVTTDLEDLDDDIFMSGIDGSDGYATSEGGGGGFVSIAYFDNTTDAYVVPGSTSDNFEHGRGYEVWLGDNLTTWGAQAWTLDGTVNVATANLSVNAAGGGWNLLANPFPAFLDFSTINTNNSKIQHDEWWYYDADLASYNSNGTGVDIPPGQGFWIDWSSGTNTLNLDISSDIIDLSSSTHYKTDEKEELRIGIRQDSSIFGSAVFLRKDQMAFAGVDENDLTPLRLPDPRSSLLVIEYAGEDMMLNYVSDVEDHIEIPMRFEAGLPGDYTMSFKGLDYFEDYQCINIIDEKDGKQIEITPSTSLKVRIGESLSERKFKLLLSKADYADCLAPEDLSDEDIRITAVGKTIMTDFFLDRSVSADITIYNVLGAPVFSTNKPVGYSREKFDLNHLQSGLYVVNVSINGSTTTEKVILQ
ncbi:MAG: T9SS type A sorting domain-containing protein, partial [Flavobacteriales bacterium]|nr:T9SS type A sorting domain-containing protein [Flavobacteriales bacterium]